MIFGLQYSGLLVFVPFVVLQLSFTRSFVKKKNKKLNGKSKTRRRLKGRKKKRSKMKEIVMHKDCKENKKLKNWIRNSRRRNGNN